MTTAVSSLAPQAVWQWFSDFCSIPHPTFHEKTLSDFIVQKAQEKGLKVQRDAMGSILIQKEGTFGLENRPRVAIQAHIDMVPQKGVESNHQFDKDHIQTIIKDGWVFANDTTLGADNGIGASMGLALVFSDDIPHPPLDLVLTVEEETGMGGARQLQAEWLSAPAMINLDSEDEGILFVGCAGGRDATFSLPFNRQAVQGHAYRIHVSGLKGGHSGIDIDSGRANANLLLARVLSAVAEQSPFQLADIKGGSLRNVIPREASALIVTQKELDGQLLTHIADIINAEYSAVESAILVQAEPVSEVTEACSLEDTQGMLALIRSIPNGVIRMSDAFEGVVETSISMGVLLVQEGKLLIRCLMRSLLDTPKDDLSSRLQSIAHLAGAELELAADYPGWRPDPQSALLAKCKTLFTEFYGQEPKVEVMHAGLECGILKGHAPHMEMISFGPNIRAAHSPKECVEIASVETCWKILLKLLQEK